MISIRKSVKGKLGLGFGLIMALTLALGALAVMGTQQVSHFAARLYTEDMASLTAIKNLQELTADMGSRMRAPLAYSRPDADRALGNDLAVFRKKIDAALDDYSRLSIRDPAIRTAADKVAADYKLLEPVSVKFVEEAAAGDAGVAQRFYDGNVRKPLESALADLDTLWDKQIVSAAGAFARDQESVQRIDAIMIAVIVAAMLGTFIIVFLLTRMITRPLSRARELVESIADGRLDNDVAHRFKDEFGVMLTALGHMQQRLAEIVHDVRQSSESVSVGAGEIASGNDELSSRTQEQAANLQETAASMEQMTSTVKQNADNAAQADQLARGVRTQAHEGGEVVGRAVAAMEQIDAASRKISDIVGLIDDIAFQTNLLALNASVEAARAGEQGRGFAVVASEVRNLASRSAAAAKDIKELVNDSAAKVADGSQQVALSGQTLDAIVESVNKVSDIISEIAAASGEQSSGIEQVNHAVSQMDSVTQQNASLVEQSAAASRSLEDQAAALKRQVAFFRFVDHDDTAEDAPEDAAVDEAPVVDRPHAATPVRAPAVAGPAAPALAEDGDWATF